MNLLSSIHSNGVSVPSLWDELIEYTGSRDGCWISQHFIMKMILELICKMNFAGIFAADFEMALLAFLLTLQLAIETSSPLSYASWLFNPTRK